MTSPDKFSLFDKSIYKNSLLAKQADLRIKKNGDALQEIDLETSTALRMRSFSTVTASTLGSIQTSGPQLLTPVFNSLLQPQKPKSSNKTHRFGSLLD